MPRKPRTKPTAKAELKSKTEEEFPDWATETPVIQYTLEAFFETDVERVELALEEYETLKLTLAKMRGLDVSPDFGRRHT